MIQCRFTGKLIPHNLNIKEGNKVVIQVKEKEQGKVSGRIPYEWQEEELLKLNYHLPTRDELLGHKQEILKTLLEQFLNR